MVIHYCLLIELLDLSMITRLLKCLNFAEFGGDMKAIQMHESLYTSQNQFLVYFMVNFSPIFSLLKLSTFT